MFYYEKNEDFKLVWIRPQSSLKKHELTNILQPYQENNHTMAKRNIL